MNLSLFDEFERLSAAVLDKTVSPEELRRFNAILREFPELSSVYFEQSRMHAVLECQGWSRASAARGLHASVRPTRPGTSRWLRIAAAAAIVVLVVGGAVWRLGREIGLGGTDGSGLAAAVFSSRAPSDDQKQDDGRVVTDKEPKGALEIQDARPKPSAAVEISSVRFSNGGPPVAEKRNPILMEQKTASFEKEKTMKASQIPQVVHPKKSMAHALVSRSVLAGVALATSGASIGMAGPLAYDDLESAALGALNGQATGVGFSDAYGAEANAVVVNDHPLAYSNGVVRISGGSQCIRVTYPDKKPVFWRGIGSLDGDELWQGFLFETPTADSSYSSDHSRNEDLFSLGFAAATKTESTACVIHRYNADSTDHAFGIRTNTNYEVRGMIGTESNRTYLVLLRLRKLTPGADQPYNELALFVDPATAYAPEPDLVVTNASGALMTYVAARIALSETGDTYYIDNLCVGATYNSVAFPLGDSPVTDQPVFEPRNGTVFVGTGAVALSCPTAGAEIRYTLDGSDPTPTGGTLYTGPFELTSSATIRAIACVSGKQDSVISRADYVVQTHWTGAAGDTLWSSVGNWDPAHPPADNDVVFDSVGTNKVSVTNNVVDGDVTLRSLEYANTGNGYHVMRIGAGNTLTMTGGTSSVNAFFLGSLVQESGQTYTRVRITGEGSFVVSAPDSDFLISKLSSNYTGYGTLDCSGLGVFDASVSTFYVGRGKRTLGTLTLPQGENGASSVTAEKCVIGDSDGDDSGGPASVLNLGTRNTFHVGMFGVAATAWGNHNVNSGSVAFSPGLADPFLVVRGVAGGDSRADLTVGSHQGTPWANTTPRSIAGLLDLTSGRVDARIGTLTVGEGQGNFWSGNYAAAVGTVKLGAGLLDAVSVTLGHSVVPSKIGTTFATGTLTVSNGVVSARQVILADNDSGAGQPVAGNLNVLYGSEVAVSEGVVMGVHDGTATGIVARVCVDGGSLRVGGDVAPGTDSDILVSELFLMRGSLAVTNGAGDAAVRIERGVFALAGGTATVNRLVLTNAWAENRIELRGTGTEDYGRVTVSGALLLGGSLNVSLKDYTAKGGDCWSVVSGSGTRDGKFASVALPEGMKIVYTDNGFSLVYPRAGTVVMLL